MSAMLAIAMTLAPQVAVTAADTADARCMVVIGTMGMREKDPIAEMKYAAGAMFYVGKIIGRSGEQAVKAAMETVEKEDIEKNQAALAKSCAAELTKTGALMRRQDR